MTAAVTIEKRRRRWLRWALLPPYVWLLIFFLAPFAIILKISFADPLVAQPPFTPLLDWGAALGDRLFITFDNYLFLFQDGFYSTIYANSVKMAAIATVLCLLVGYPMAYFIARQPQPWRTLCLLGVILPFWISFLLRVYAWIGLLNTKGVINNVLLGTGLIDQPLTLIYNDFAVYLGIVYSYLPFMILPLYANLERLDLIAGCLLVFIPAIGEFVIPALLGGADTLMIGRVLWDEFFINRDWPVASAVSVVLLLILVLPMIWLQNVEKQEA
jgi:putrescine transport system permease protein